MGNARGERRDFDALRRRRLEASELIEKGFSKTEVARRIGVTRQTVQGWARTLRKSGTGGLLGAGRAGPKPKLKENQLLRIGEIVRRINQPLTNRDLALLISYCAKDVQYSPAHAGRIATKHGWVSIKSVGKRCASKTRKELAQLLAAVILQSKRRLPTPYLI